MKRSKSHLVRHFGASKLFQQHETTAQMIGNVPVIIRRAGIMHSFEPPPDENTLTLRACIDALYDMSAPHHKRGRGGSRVSQKHKDLTCLGSMRNGPLL